MIQMNLWRRCFRLLGGKEKTLLLKDSILHSPSPSQLNIAGTPILLLLDNDDGTKMRSCQEPKLCLSTLCHGEGTIRSSPRDYLASK